MSLFWRCLWFLYSKRGNAVRRRKPPGAAARMDNGDGCLLPKVAAHRVQLLSVASAILYVSVVLKIRWLPPRLNKDSQYRTLATKTWQVEFIGRAQEGNNGTSHSQPPGNLLSLLPHLRHNSTSALVQKKVNKTNFNGPPKFNIKQYRHKFLAYACGNITWGGEDCFSSVSPSLFVFTCLCGVCYELLLIPHSRRSSQLPLNKRFVNIAVIQC